jgi:hypothetical protein
MLDVWLMSGWRCYGVVWFDAVCLVAQTLAALKKIRIVRGRLSRQHEETIESEYIRRQLRM